ncbi:cache domain-containing protein, partial [Haliangium sp.]|uniref:cache domain-containing protein n=1 Tax=Haliangium sp. TaxID=2663208 RepID=UPI003D0B3379
PPTTGTVEHDRLPEVLTRAITMDPDLYRVGVAFSPFTYDPNLRLHSVAFRSNDGVIEPLSLDATVDYVSTNVDWYHEPLRAGHGVWLDPGFDEHGVHIATYATPFGTADTTADGAHGVVIVSYSLARLERLLYTIDLGEAGYSYVLSTDGHYLYHPNQELVDAGAAILDTARELGDPALEALGREAIAGARVFGEGIDPTTGSPAWILMEPVSATGWILVVTLIRDQLVPMSKDARSTLIELGMSLLVVAMGLAVVIAGRFARTRTLAWVLSSLFALLCLIMLSVILLLVDRTAHAVHWDRTRVPNHAAVRDFLRQYDRRALSLRDELPVYVPTGIYVKSVTFKSANEVLLTGYVWQKYQRGVHDGLSRGFIMPEAEASEIIEHQVDRHGDTEHHVWEFKVTLNQAFDYSRYPVGRENVWIQLWHRDFMQNVVLVPDLDAYKLTIPSARPGIEQSLSLPGWDIESTYFSYRKHTYDTDFGLGDYAGLTSFPELYFNIPIRKQILGPVISHLLPIGVVMMLLFTILMLSTRQKSRVELLGFNTMNVVTACAGFFLVVVFSHIDLRETLSAKGIVYLEYFYFVTYVAILLVAVNALLFSGTQSRIIHHRDNLLPKLMFWPATMGMLLFLTLLTFYFG